MDWLTKEQTTAAKHKILRYAVATFGVIAFVLVVVLLAAPAKAQDFRHLPGVDDHSGPDHWYDAWCCNQRDCRPAKPGELSWEVKGWRHNPSGYLYPHSRVLTIPKSAPEADRLVMHVCEHLYDDWDEDLEENVKAGQPRCIYGAEAGG